MFGYICTILVFIIAVTQAHEDTSSFLYGSEIFKEELPKKNHFVMFFAPWCDHCQRLAPTWAELAEKYNQNEDGNLVVARVDCTKEAALCSEQDITGYPTLKFFKAGSDEGVKFRGVRNIQSLETFINDQQGFVQEYFDEDSGEGYPSSKFSILPDLTDETFDEHISEGKHFVMFYAPWCRECKNMAPDWEKLARKHFANPDDRVFISRIDCSAYRSICLEHDVKAYPTLLWIEDGKVEKEYQGENSYEVLESFVTRMASGNAGEVNDEVIASTSETFRSDIQSGLSFVKFYAPWCGHCKTLAPTWQALAKKLGDKDNVKILQVDCTNHINRHLCDDEEVNGFPTLVLYKDGSRIHFYEGSRALGDLYDFVSSYIGHDEL